jgi:hypothetical protein
LTSLGDVKDVVILGALAVGAYYLYGLLKDPVKTITEQTSPLTTFGNPITAAPYELGKTIGEIIAKPWVSGYAAFTGLFNREGAPISPGGLNIGDNL